MLGVDGGRGANSDDRVDGNLRNTIRKYARGGLLGKRELANAFEELDISNPNYAAAEALNLLNRGTDGYIRITDQNDVDQIVTYASSRLSSRDMRGSYLSPSVFSGGYDFAPGISLAPPFVPYDAYGLTWYPYPSSRYWRRGVRYPRR